MPSFATTVTQEGLTASFDARWVRPIWYQPGATISFGEGFAFPVTRRLWRLERSHRITLNGRVAVEYGDEERPPPASDLEHAGPTFVAIFHLSDPAIGGSSQPTIYTFAGTRSVRIDRVELRDWLSGAASVGNAGNPTVRLDNETFLNGAPTGGPFNVNLTRFDPDSFLTIPPAATGISVNFKNSCTGSQGVTELAAIVMPGDATNQRPRDIDFGVNGPVIYPLSQAGYRSAFKLSAVNFAATDKATVYIYGHEELF